MYDVVIIGAGPVGSRAARMLAENGLRVAVVDKKINPDGPVCCTGIVGMECIRTYEIPTHVIHRYANCARIHSPEKNILNIAHPEPQAAILDRPALNRFLAEIASKAGAEYYFDYDVDALETGPDKVRIHSYNGKPSIDTQAVVDAGGAGSRFPEHMGLGRIGDFAMGAQAEVTARNLDMVEVFTGKSICDGVFGWLVPTAKGQALVGLMSRSRTGYYLNRLIDSLHNAGKIDASGAEISYANVPLKPLSKTYGDRFLVTGGAAGQAKPTTGGGIYYGMICADIAAETLVRSWREQNFSAKSLSRYQTGWKRKLGKEIRIGSWSRKLYETLSDGQIESIINIAVKNGLDKAILESEDLNFDWHSSSIIRLLRARTITGVIGSFKLPLPLGKK